VVDAPPLIVAALFALPPNNSCFLRLGSKGVKNGQCLVDHQQTSVNRNSGIVAIPEFLLVFSCPGAFFGFHADPTRWYDPGLLTRALVKSPFLYGLSFHFV